MIAWNGARWRVGALAWLLALATKSPAGADEPSATPAGRAAQPGASYEEFVRAHERPILNYLWRLTGDEQLAYDLTQETFLRAWTRFEQVSGYENPRGWLFHVATNLGLTALTRGKVSKTRTGVLSQEPGFDPAASDPAQRLVEQDQVRATLLQLNPQRRAALVLREVYGLSCAEVAKALGISEVATRMTLSRAREQFRTLYLREEAEHDA